MKNLCDVLATVALAAAGWMVGCSRSQAAGAATDEDTWCWRAVASLGPRGISRVSLQADPGRGSFPADRLQTRLGPDQVIPSPSNRPGRLKVEVGARTGLEPPSARLPDGKDHNAKPGREGEFMFLELTVRIGWPRKDHQFPPSQPASRYTRDSHGRIYDRTNNVTWTMPSFKKFVSWREAQAEAKKAGLELPTLEQLASLAAGEASLLPDQCPVYLDTRFFPSAYTRRGGSVLVWSSGGKRRLLDTSGLYYDFTNKKKGSESHGDERANVFYVQPGDKTEGAR